MNKRYAVLPTGEKLEKGISQVVSFLYLAGCHLMAGFTTDQVSGSRERLLQRDGRVSDTNQRSKEEV